MDQNKAILTIIIKDNCEEICTDKLKIEIWEVIIDLIKHQKIKGEKSNEIY